MTVNDFEIEIERLIEDARAAQMSEAVLFGMLQDAVEALIEASAGSECQRTVAISLKLQFTLCQQPPPPTAPLQVSNELWGKSPASLYHHLINV